MTAPEPDPVHDALTAAEQAVAALWPARGVEPHVPDLGPNVTADRVAALVGILEHLDPIVQRMVEHAAPGDASAQVFVFASQLRQASTTGTVAHQYLTALQDPDRPRS